MGQRLKEANDVQIGIERPFRFGVINERALPGPEWLAQVRRIEELGYDTFLIRDHLRPDFFGPQYAPLVALAAAAQVTTRLRFGTLVIDNDFRHPAMLAKEAATLDALSGGRFELGLGAGWLHAEYQAAGIPFAPAGRRIDRLAESIQVLKRLLAPGPASYAGAHYAIDELENFPQPAQRPGLPLLLGGGKRRMLTLAGREADIVSLLTSSVASGTMSDDPAERLVQTVARKLDWVREGAGARFDRIELNMIPTVVYSDDPERSAAELVRRRGWDQHGVTVADVLAMPSVLIGSVDGIVAQLRARRERYGISYWAVSDHQAEEFAPVVARAQSRDREAQPAAAAPSRA